MNTEECASPTISLTWRKSSYSGGDGGECVEVATSADTVHVRDSKNVDLPHLAVSTVGWGAFVNFAAGR